MPDPRPLSEITAEAQRKLSPIERGLDWQRRDQINEVRRLLAELSARLDGAVVLTREDAEKVNELLANVNCLTTFKSIGKRSDALREACVILDAALCGRPGKETE